ncbi:hypothetical protein HUA74_05140 [Myxococcus sp. CA051A]|uniref:hypothetical protein n=1 Tax=unclassified Myxococcus TaxID=2648731 RepID=UPI00157B9D41|nr:MULTISPECIES: hypothetical protein [unclassified Myxococcus]NTX01412.1 hypothetical protein [Myxococcus sp. CA040A]NTX15562.1 hypothetical protein [Myxococcus sp. CA056]NTX32896.1 hypothetical protein [Myxococcus sp. CA033]NTX57276.1 hypothetical protein [Myxococcus sp. CA039A]NTX60038.1 hypothetical protein [Myxococcus sp. CA051A]
MAGEDAHYNVISTLYHLLKGASTAEQFIQDAERAGDPELAQFFRDWRDEQRHLAERAKNLLGARLGTTERAAATGSAGRKRAAGSGKSSPKGPVVRDQSNAGVKSGGTSSDDLVDELSKESFPASDSPSTY